MMLTLTWFTFIVVYLGLGLGHLPKLKLDRTGIALVGSAILLAAGVLNLHEAARSVDVETLLLLFSMMVIVGLLKLTGFFAWISAKMASRFENPHALLAAVIASSGVLSAFFVNDVVCVAFTPLVLQVCRKTRNPPLPFLIALATASNVGSVATITGNPQNVMIGSLSHLSYLRFFARLAPVALLGLALNFGVIALIFKKSLATKSEVPLADSLSSASESPRTHLRLIRIAVGISLAVVASFFFVSSIAIAALAGAAVLFMVSRIKPEKIYREIDWTLLLMFAALFVVVHAFEVQVVSHWGIASWTWLKDSPVVAVSAVSAGLSNLVSNVPAVLLFKPIMTIFSDQEQAWLALAMSSTLAGNLTLLGSVANLIVVENCRRAGIKISFSDYLKVGVLLTLLTLAIGVAWLSFTHY